MIELKSMCMDHSLVYPNCDVTLFSTEWASLSLSTLSFSCSPLSLSSSSSLSLTLSLSLSLLSLSLYYPIPTHYLSSFFFSSRYIYLSLSHTPLSPSFSLSINLSFFLSISTAMLVGWLSLPIGWSHVMRSFRCDEFACTTPTPTWIQMFWRATSKKPINHYYLFPT